MHLVQVPHLHRLLAQRGHLVAQVYDEFLHAFGDQVELCDAEFLPALAGELGEGDIAGRHRSAQRLISPQNAAIFATVLPRPPVFLRASRTKYNMLAISVINEAVTDNVLAFF